MRRLPPLWVMGLANGTLGFASGIMNFVMPQLMASVHVPEPKIALITAIAVSPNFWFVLFGVVVLQVVTEVVIGFNYALGLVFVTPMALLMTSLAAPAAAASMPMARVLDTALGALVGVAFALVFSTLDDRVHLATHHAGKQPG